jgi:hypothetical protein
VAAADRSGTTAAITFNMPRALIWHRCPSWLSASFP